MTVYYLHWKLFAPPFGSSFILPYFMHSTVRPYFPAIRPSVSLSIYHLFCVRLADTFLGDYMPEIISLVWVLLCLSWGLSEGFKNWELFVFSCWFFNWKSAFKMHFKSFLIAIVVVCADFFYFAASHFVKLIMLSRIEF